VTVAAAVSREDELPGLAAVAELLARAGAASPLARTVPVVGRLAEGCLGEPADWRAAALAWQRLEQLAGAVAAEVEAVRRTAGPHWRQPELDGVDDTVRRAARQLTGVGAVATAMASAGTDLHAVLLDAHLRFVSATVAAAARAQLAAGYPDPAERVVQCSAVLGEWLAQVLPVVAGALTRCARLTGAAGPVAGSLAGLTALADGGGQP
jgi:hypothetical protein